ncbi:MAG: hypothetical protein RLY78_1582 [Pseudomonadota bacterium]
MIYVKTPPTRLDPSAVSPAARGRHRRALAAAVALVVSAAGLLAGASEAQAQTEAQHLPAITLQAGMHLIRAELARTPAERQTGLMFRRDLGPNDGMLFVFEEPAVQCFWMRNTLTPLDIAFVEDDGRIVNLDQMAPLSDDSHCSKKPVRFVLEMNRGWFARRGIQGGFKLGGAPFSGAR